MKAVMMRIVYLFGAGMVLFGIIGPTWTGNWGPEVGWAIRIAMVVLGVGVSVKFLIAMFKAQKETMKGKPRVEISNRELVRRLSGGLAILMIFDIVLHLLGYRWKLSNLFDDLGLEPATVWVIRIVVIALGGGISVAGTLRVMGRR